MTEPRPTRTAHIRLNKTTIALIRDGAKRFGVSEDALIAHAVGQWWSFKVREEVLQQPESYSARTGGVR